MCQQCREHDYSLPPHREISRTEDFLLTTALWSFLIFALACAGAVTLKIVRWSIN